MPARIATARTAAPMSGSSRARWRTSYRGRRRRGSTSSTTASSASPAGPITAWSARAGSSRGRTSSTRLSGWAATASGSRISWPRSSRAARSARRGTPASAPSPIRATPASGAISPISRSAAAASGRGGGVLHRGRAGERRLRRRQRALCERAGLCVRDRGGAAGGVSGRPRRSPAFCSRWMMPCSRTCTTPRR